MVGNGATAFEQRLLAIIRKRSMQAHTKARYAQEDNVDIVQRVSAVAEARGLPMAQAALAWATAKPVVTAPIIGATKPHHLEDAIAALPVKLTPDKIQHLEEAYHSNLVIGFS